MSSGNFINTTHNDVLSIFTDVQKDILKNPYYLFNDQKATAVDYYQINKKQSTLDEVLRTNYSDLGDLSPFRFNLIKNFYLYGIDRISLNLEFGDFGTEANEISGEATIIPNTIQPFAGDFFKIKHIIDGKESTYLFKVSEVQTDTLNNGSNAWKINYILERQDLGDIDKQVVDVYKFLVKNVGTEFNPIIKSNTYDLTKKLDDISIILKEYYKELFYNDKVQTFTFNTMMGVNNFYDPNLIEFLIRNNILDNSGMEYIYVDHKLRLGKTFVIDYSKTLFHALEERDLNHFCNCNFDTDAEFIDNPMSIFSTRSEKYFRLTHKVSSYDDITRVIPILPPDIIDKLKNNLLYEDDNYKHLNIIIKYLNDNDIEYEDLVTLESIIYEETNINLFFVIPMLIFCIESQLKKLLSVN